MVLQCHLPLGLNGRLQKAAFHLSGKEMFILSFCRRLGWVVPCCSCDDTTVAMLCFAEEIYIMRSFANKDRYSWHHITERDKYVSSLGLQWDWDFSKATNHPAMQVWNLDTLGKLSFCLFQWYINVFCNYSNFPELTPTLYPVFCAGFFFLFIWTESIKNKTQVVKPVVLKVGEAKKGDTVASLLEADEYSSFSMENLYMLKKPSKKLHKF